MKWRKRILRWLRNTPTGSRCEYCNGRLRIAEKGQRVRWCSDLCRLKSKHGHKKGGRMVRRIKRLEDLVEVVR